MKITYHSNLELEKLQRSVLWAVVSIVWWRLSLEFLELNALSWDRDACVRLYLCMSETAKQELNHWKPSIEQWDIIIEIAIPNLFIES